MDAEKVFDRAEHPFMIRSLRTRRNFLNLIKRINEKPIASIMLMGKRLNDFPPNTGNVSRVPPHHCCSTSFWKVSNATRQEKEIKGIQSSTSGISPSVFSPHPRLHGRST